MFNTIITKENSKNLLERVRFLKRLKELKEMAKMRLKELETELIFHSNLNEKYPDEEFIAKEKEFIRKLEQKIENYDLYQQKSPYVCQACHLPEVDCTCLLKN